MHLSHAMLGMRAELGLAPVHRSAAFGSAAHALYEHVRASPTDAVELEHPALDQIGRQLTKLGSAWRPNTQLVTGLANGTILPSGVRDAVQAATLRTQAQRVLATHFAEGALVGRSAMPRAPRVTGNTAQILVRDEEYLPRLWQDIRAARDSVTVTMYNVEDAGSGEQLVRELAELKTRRPSVDVRMVLDAHGTNEPGKERARALLAKLDAAGIDYVVSSSPLRRGGGGWEHRKIVVVDDRVVYQGGLGFAGTQAGKYGTWMDAMVRMEGPVGAVGAVHSLAMWNDLTGTVDPRAHERLAGALDALTGARHIVPAPVEDAPAAMLGAPATDVPITLLENRPGHDLAITEQLLRDAAASRSGDLLHASSSYLTSPVLSRAFQDAARHGADTRLVLSALSGENDVWPIRLGRGLYRGLLDSGVHLTQWEGRMMHHKSWMRRPAGESPTVHVGSLNFSNMSMRHSRESTAQLEGEAIARQYERFHEILRTNADRERYSGGYARDVQPSDIGTEWSDSIVAGVRHIVPGFAF